MVTKFTQHWAWVHEVDVFTLGSALIQDEAIGATVLHVIDAADFDVDGGAVQVNGELMGYVSSDADAETVTLSGPLAVAASEGDDVIAWDLDNDRPAAESRALVEFMNNDGDDDPVPVSVSAALASKLRRGSRGGRGETVLLEGANGLWRLIDIAGIDVDEGADANDHVPMAPEGLMLSSSVYSDGPVLRAELLMVWDPVVAYTDGVPLAEADIKKYEIEAYEGSYSEGVTWRSFISVSGTTLEVRQKGWPTGSTWSFRVRAVDTAGLEGEWAADYLTFAVDTTAPPQPSAPTVTSRLGTFMATWNGKTAAGGNMPPDFAFAEIHCSLSSGFTPVKGDVNTMVARLTGAGYGVKVGTYGVNHYFRIIAVDTSGNVSVPSDQTGAVVTPLVNTDLIGQIIAGANIVDGSITASDKIIGNTITGALIQALTIQTGDLAANSVTADKMEFGSLNGQLITGLQIQTSTSALQGIKLKNTGLTAYDGSTQTFEINASTGAVTMKGTLTSGSIITGAVLQTATSGKRIVIRNDGSGGIIESYSGLSGETPGALDPGVALGLPTMTLKPGTTPSSTHQPSIQLRSTNVGNGDIDIWGEALFQNSVRVNQGGAGAGQLSLGPNTTIPLLSTNSITGNGNINLTFGNIYSTSGTVSGDAVQVSGVPTSAAAANCVMTSTGFLQRSTSSERFKTDITDAVIDVGAVLALQPREYTSMVDDEDTWRPRSIGFIAEEAAALGHDHWLTYDADGRVDGFAYAAWVVALHAVAQAQAQELADLRVRVRALEMA